LLGGYGCMKARLLSREGHQSDGVGLEVRAKPQTGTH
jgi:hypothetical protein